jgi:polysaccharide export outer membrane protein
MSRYLFCLALCIAALGGCSAPRYTDDAQFRADVYAPYQLASGDRLRVIVFGQDQLSNSFSVDGAGNISMPLIGVVRVLGLRSASPDSILSSTA